MSSITIPISSILDQLCSVHDETVAALRGDPSQAAWLSAVNRAWERLIDEQRESVTVLDIATDHAVVIVASDTTDGLTYQANGRCACIAFTRGNPCDHRAEARLVLRALTRTLEQAAAREGTTLDALLEEATAQWRGPQYEARRRRAREQTRAMSAVLSQRQDETAEARLARARAEIAELY